MGTPQVDGGIGFGSLRLVGPCAEYQVFKKIYMGEGQGWKPSGVGMDIHFPTTSSIREDWFFTRSWGQGRENPPLLSYSVFSKDHLLDMNG